jgi:hypothetical protein
MESEAIIDLASRKLNRALVQRTHIYASVSDYIDSQPYETFLKPDSEYEHWQPTAQPSPDISVLVGEMLYQLRSTLDHLFFALVKRDEGP